MPWIVAGLPLELQKKLEGNYKTPCPDVDKKKYEELVIDLQLNPEGLLIPHENDSCEGLLPVQPINILKGISVDEPTKGMDQNLEPSADPRNDRQWMGGRTSHDFRHQYFAGWKLTQPLQTVQLPLRSIGEAHRRVETLARKAKSFVEAKDLVWGSKVLAWAVHYLQELSQPTHVTQIPYFRMALWHHLFTWPPSEGLSLFQKESRRTLKNYELAYEKYVFRHLQRGRESIFVDCLSDAGRDTPKALDDPLRLALETAKRSRKLSSALGQAIYDYFGPALKKKYFDLEIQKGLIDYAGLENSRLLQPVREKMDQLTCKALELTADQTRKLIQWAYD